MRSSSHSGGHISEDERRAKVAMISGASRGIGLAIARRLKSEGYHLSLGIRRPDQLPPGGPADPDHDLVCAYQATSMELARSWVEKTVARFGVIDALINNAAILRTVGFEDGDESMLDELWQTNVKGPIRMIRLALPHLRRARSGKIINIASLSGKRVTGGTFGYAMTKFAIMAITHSARLACWDDGVRATAICPGWVNTDMVAGISSVPAGDMTQPEDIAASVSFILSLPATASVAEFSINCLPGSRF